MTRMTHQDRERLVFSMVIGLVLNVALFLAIEALVKLEAARPPKDYADLQVELQVEEVPVPDRVAEAETPKPAEPAPAPVEPVPTPQPQPPVEPEVKAQPAPAPTPAPKPAAPRPAVPKAAAAPVEPPKDEPIKEEFRIPSGPVVQAAEPPKPSTPTFKTEGDKIVTGQAPAPTAPQPQKAQPLTEPAPAESAPALPQAPAQKAVQGQGASTPEGSGSILPLNQLDQALGAGSRAPAAPEGQSVSGGGRAPAPPTGGLPAGRGAPGAFTPGDQPFQIEFVNPAEGRRPVRTPLPDLPPQAKQGQRLTVIVEFVLTPQGFIFTAKPVKSSGYPAVDSAVVNAVRRWTFEPVRSADNVKGQVTYTIVSG